MDCWVLNVLVQVGHILADFDGLCGYKQKAVVWNGTQITHSLPRSKRAAALSPKKQCSFLLENISKHYMIKKRGLLTQALILWASVLWLHMNLVSSVISQQLLSQTSDGNPAWNHRLPLCIFDNLYQIHWQSQTHHSVPRRSQTLRGWTRLGIVPAAPLASDTAQQYWGSFLGCAANTLIISLYHRAVMGYRPCQLKL